MNDENEDSKKRKSKTSGLTLSEILNQPKQRKKRSPSFFSIKRDSFGNRIYKSRNSKKKQIRNKKEPPSTSIKDNVEEDVSFDCI